MLKTQQMTIEAGGDINAGEGGYNVSTQARYEEFARSRMMNEPVAVVSGYYGGQCVILPTNPARLFTSGTALYTTAQRQWVGLTDEERQEIWKGCDPQHAGYVTALVEAKLKEKNT
jgi:hypothetical protein